ncbi:MAG TPA: AAA family ATPase, partial [Dehalococcoidia bacterium]|nr:AAA family ATPase [Dehalococcoidia bacterium]
DKLCGPKIEVGRDVSGEGVQRDLLPIVEGTTVMTRFGPVKTDYILFIAAGAFYDSKPSDLIPELQGRLPLRVELKALSPQDLERILEEPENSLTKQYHALLATEGVELDFTREGIAEMAFWASRMNEKMENIGARRLYTIMEQVLEELSFAAPQRQGEKVMVDQAYVREHLGNLLRDEDLSRYIL